MTSLQLPATELHVWVADLNQFIEPEAQQFCWSVVSEDEGERAKRFYFDKHRQRFLAARGIVRSLLSQYENGTAPQQWQFEIGPFGKPSIVAPALSPAIHFNISHSGERIVIVLGHEPDVGVDIEMVKPRKKLEAIAKRHFAANEYKAMMNLELKLQRQRFFDLWTLKESYIKAWGKGLAIPLKSFGFRFTTDNQILLDEQVEEAGHWRFWQYDDSDEYKLAVALRSTAALPEKKLVVKDLVNFSQSKNADLRLLRTGS